uniref:Uncharacterized protein n=1 Tax=Serinus canaria TaxID=9135 RepID=A0A8C9NMB9_SERCA
MLKLPIMKGKCSHTEQEIQEEAFHSVIQRANSSTQEQTGMPREILHGEEAERSKEKV